jgi:hypothetical protein
MRGAYIGLLPKSNLQTLCCHSECRLQHPRAHPENLLALPGPRGGLAGEMTLSRKPFAGRANYRIIKTYPVVYLWSLTGIYSRSELLMPVVFFGNILMLD